MIKKFNYFLLENLKNELSLILEAYIKGSDKFLSKLKEISKEKGTAGKIASDILNSLKDDFIDEYVKQNYFDLTDKADMVSFIQQNKVGSGDGFALKGRGEIKIGKAIKYLCSLIYNPTDIPSDKDIEIFVNIFKASKSNKEIEFKLVGGPDIAKYYHEDSYHKGYGTLGGSCMANKRSDYFDLYAENPKKVHLLIYVDQNDKIHGRALIWKLDKSPCEAKYFMDRIYTNSDADMIKFKKYAEDQGWMHKVFNRSWVEDGVQFIYQGKEVYGEVVVRLEDGDFDEYPFLDTMCFLNEEKTSLSNLSDINSYYLKDTGGECNLCDECDGKLTYHCDECDGSGKIECWDCDGDGESECDECDGDGKIECCDCNDGMVDCDECDGTGEVEGKTRNIKCKKCKGTGNMKCQECKGTALIECDECDGKGKIECDRCDGSGKMECDECDGDNSGLCDECSKGHVILSDHNIPTKHNKKILKSKKK